MSSEAVSLQAEAPAVANSWEAFPMGGVRPEGNVLHAGPGSPASGVTVYSTGPSAPAAPAQACRCKGACATPTAAAAAEEGGFRKGSACAAAAATATVCAA